METNLDEIRNFLPINDKLGTAGLPTEEQFDLLKEAGYEVVINLAMPNQPGAIVNEAEIVAELGMDYLSIPVLFSNPTSDDLHRMMDALDAHAGQKVFVHCMANQRVASFIYLYRVLRLGVPQAEAETLLHRIWQPNPVWAEFIRAELARGMAAA
jgi:protein tyrosine phosphatase (PTP) superfamily phosphohydrolase (DUF442 family)